MKHSRPFLGRYVVPDMPSADELLPYLRRIDDNRWYSNFGPLVQEFEDRMERHLSLSDKKNDAGPLALLTTSSCHASLQIGLQLLQLPPGAKILVPAITFPACPLAVRHAGAETVLADVDPDNWQLTPEIARRIAAQNKIDAVMPVAVYGVPVDADGWDAFTDETGVPVIIDAAAALDAQPIPAKALIAFSMHATKPFSIGEGGLLVCRDQALIAEAQRLSNFGTTGRITHSNGLNAKLSEYAAAVALAQLDRWPLLKEKRKKLYEKYRAALEKTGLALTFQQGVDRATVGSLMLRTETGTAEAIASALNARGIFAHRMYLPPLYSHPYFADLKLATAEGRILTGGTALQDKRHAMRHAESLQQSLFGLPFHNFITDEDIHFTVQALTDIMGQSELKRAAH